MKRFYGILFLFSLFTGLVQPALPLIEYYLFQESIIELFCVNKESEEMDCDGFCYLQNQIEQQQENQESRPFSLLNLEDILSLFLTVQPRMVEESGSSGCFFLNRDSGYLSQATADIFQPPRKG